MPLPFRPRFSVRTLVILVTLACVYFGIWDLTKRGAVRPPPGRRIFTLDGEQLVLPIEGQETFGMSDYLSMSDILDDGGGFFVLLEVRALAPLVIVQDQQVIEKSGPNTVSKDRIVYYLWLFGPKFKLFQQ